MEIKFMKITSSFFLQSSGKDQKKKQPEESWTEMNACWKQQVTSQSSWVTCKKRMKRTGNQKDQLLHCHHPHHHHRCHHHHENDGNPYQSFLPVHYSVC